MQVWFYFREAEPLDFVYYDGTYSNILNKNKTVVGRCFYINPDNPSQRLMVGTKDLTAYPWGLLDTRIPSINLADNPSYSVYNLAALVDITSAGTTTINEANYRDPSTKDGFKVFDPNTACGQIGFRELTSDVEGHTKGEILPIGQIQTLEIIKHRDTILKDSNINLPVPKDLADLYNCIADIMAKNNTDYSEFYYPPASQCYLYVPETKEGEVLSPKFGQGNWFLPSIGELARIVWYKNNLLEEGIFTTFAYLRSSTEYNVSYIWYNNSSTTINNLNSKGLSNDVSRPVCAF